MSDHVRLLCMRHAESVNVTTRAVGALPDARLTPRGHEQAAEAARLLAGEGVTHVYASTALRARQTARRRRATARTGTRSRRAPSPPSRRSPRRIPARRSPWSVTSGA
ncbi:hypothetical protein E1292_01305 [Nonomuraea deserti]|uniref:Histidine phosphatase family protein n=1 Tax=Nonomuraea deserti TaxID=1848322 RepID=A0A4R4W9M8_9ACTN|nr:hypothetical protein E1292_01305 [Nonomuraea deserti]